MVRYDVVCRGMYSEFFTAQSPRTSICRANKGDRARALERSLDASLHALEVVVAVVVRQLGHVLATSPEELFTFPSYFAPPRQD